ncbi:MAG: hypothetical protein KBD56_02835 [Candidatus Eisenbacteria bacterium]|nr:hypothetical protein [Candidatus Eisenbacteria bacterium]
MPHLRERLLHNAGSKVLALALAVFLYLHVFVSQESEAVMDVPVELAGIPEGLTWAGSIPHTARVRFRGVGLDLFKMRTRVEQARLIVQVSGARPGQYQRPLVSEDVRLPENLDVQAVAVESPREISLTFDSVLRKKLAVVPRVGGRVASGYTVHGHIVVQPESVLVRGPADPLASARHIETQPIDLSDQEDLITRRVPLLVCDGCQATPSEVTVRISIERVVSRTFARLPVDVLRSRGVRVKRLEPQTGSVAISGPVSVVEALQPEDLRLSIEARGLPPGGSYSLMASVELRSPSLSGSVSIQPVEPEKFEVELE